MVSQVSSLSRETKEKNNVWYLLCRPWQVVSNHSLVIAIGVNITDRERTVQSSEGNSAQTPRIALIQAEIASAKEAVTVTDDGAKKETVMVTPTAPLITVAGDAGMTHSYPQRTFKPEEPKTTETVTPKRISQPPSPQFISFHQCPTFQNMSTDAFSKYI